MPFLSNPRCSCPSSLPLHNNDDQFRKQIFILPFLLADWTEKHTLGFVSKVWQACSSMHRISFPFPAGILSKLWLRGALQWASESWHFLLFFVFTAYREVQEWNGPCWAALFRRDSSLASWLNTNLTYPCTKSLYSIVPLIVHAFRQIHLLQDDASK